MRGTTTGEAWKRGPRPSGHRWTLAVGRWRWALGWIGVFVGRVHGAELESAEDAWRVFPAVQVVDAPSREPETPVLRWSLGEAVAEIERLPLASTAEAWRERRPVAERALRGAIGLVDLPERTPLNASEVGRWEFGDFRVENLVFESRPGFVVTANVYRPTAPATGRLPAVVSPIGHFLTPGKTARDVQARCIGLARMGCVVLVYDAIGQGERMVAGNVHHDAGYALLPLGETIAGWMVWDSQRAVDYLLSRPDVDPARVAITGNSGGGLNTLFTSALDPRFRAAVIVGFTFEYANWARYGGAHCTCTHLPGLFRALAWSEVAALAAPCHVMMLQGAEDRIFPVAGARRSGEEVERLFRAMRGPGEARFVALEGQPHAYSRPFREVMYPWMADHAIGHADAATEGDLPLLPEGDHRLLCDPDRSWVELTPTVLDLARAKALGWARRREAIPVAEVREATTRWLARGAVAAETERRAGDPTVVERRSVPGGTFEKLHFPAPDGFSIPALVWWPDAPKPGRNRRVLVADARGKAVVARSGWPEALLRAGCAVMAVDLRGRGEEPGHYRPGYDTNFRLVANQVLRGEPLVKVRAAELRRAVRYLDTRPGPIERGTSLVAIGDDGPAALLASMDDERVGRVAWAGARHSWVSWMRARKPVERGRRGDAWNDPQLRGRLEVGDDEIDLGSVLPGVTELGDLPEWIRALAPRPFLFCAARDLAAPDIRELSERFRRQVEVDGGEGRVRYEPTRDLTAERLLEWLDGR